MWEECGLAGSRVDGSRDDGLRDRSAALCWLFNLHADPIQGFPPSLGPHWEAPLAEENGSDERRLQKDRVLKASAASLRDFSMTCNIVTRSRVRFFALRRFNVGEEVIEFGLPAVNCAG
jgi:hypothetical protein